MPKKLPLVEISTPNLTEFAALVARLSNQLEDVNETIERINNFELGVTIRQAEPGK